MDSSCKGFEIPEINGYLILKFFKYLDSTNYLILIIFEMLEIGSSLKILKIDQHGHYVL
jgi:hypothetical protein